MLGSGLIVFVNGCVYILVLAYQKTPNRIRNTHNPVPPLKSTSVKSISCKSFDSLLPKARAKVGDINAIKPVRDNTDIASAKTVTRVRSKNLLPYLGWAFPEYVPNTNATMNVIKTTNQASIRTFPVINSFKLR